MGLLRMIFWNMRTFMCYFLKKGISNLKIVDLYLRNVDLYAWFSEKKWTLTWNGGPFTNEFLKYVDLYTCAIFWKKVDLNLKNVDLYAWFSEKKSTSTWKMWTFTSHFLEKKWPYILEKGTFMHDFLKNVDLDPKNVNRYASFSEKSAPLSEKCGRFTHDFLKNVDLYVQFFEKSGP